MYLENSLFCKPSHRYFFARGNRANGSLRAVLKSFKINRETVAMDYFFNKVADLEPETF